MAGRFKPDQLSCEECGDQFPSSSTTDSHSPESKTARYTLHRNMCVTCARGKCANSIVDRHHLSSSMSTSIPWACAEHTDRDVILFCTEAGCKRPICDKCLLLSHIGHKYVDINIVMDERRTYAKLRREKIAAKSKELSGDRRKIELSKEAINQRFDRLRYAVLVRVEEKSRSFEDDLCVAERKVERRAKEEKQRIDRWKDNRLRELKEEKNERNRKIQQRQCALLQELNQVKGTLLHQLEEFSEGFESADTILKEAREVAERTLAAEASDILLAEDPATTNARLEECLGLELDVDAVETVVDIAQSVKFEPENALGGDNSTPLGQFVTTQPAWCKLHTIQVGLPKFRLMSATKERENCVTFTGEHCDQRYGLYTMDIETGNTKLVTSDPACIMDATSLNNGLMAVTRSDRGAIEIWNTRIDKVKKHIKVPRTWSHTCLTTDGQNVFARDHHSNGHGKIYVYRSDTGEKVRSVPFAGTIYGLFILSNGDLVIQSAATEVVIIDGQLGTVKATIANANWKWLRCAVDGEDRIVVAYGRKDDTTSIFVDAFTSSDVTVVEHIFKHKCNTSLDHIALVATKSGRIALQNGGDILVYDRLIPLPSARVPLSSPIPSPRSTTSTPKSSSPRSTMSSSPRGEVKVFRRPRSLSSSPPERTRRHHRFMCIPT